MAVGHHLGCAGHHAGSGRADLLHHGGHGSDGAARLAARLALHVLGPPADPVGLPGPDLGASAAAVVAGALTTDAIDTVTALALAVLPAARPLRLVRDRRRVGRQVRRIDVGHRRSVGHQRRIGDVRRRVRGQRLRVPLQRRRGIGREPLREVGRLGRRIDVDQAGLLRRASEPRNC